MVKTFDKNVLKLEEDDFRFEVKGLYLNTIKCDYCPFSLTKAEYLKRKTSEDVYPKCENPECGLELTRLKYNVVLVNGLNFRFGNNPVCSSISHFVHHETDKETNEVKKRIKPNILFKEYFGEESS